MLPYLIAGVIGYGISKLFDDNKAPKYNDGGLIAPNGKPSNLTPEQYKLVRTPAFKDWFGDWENDPANASKVVDENGEPLVVYHGTNEQFNIFNKKGKGNRVLGYFFTTDKDFSKNYGESKLYFLNIKKIKNFNSERFDSLNTRENAENNYWQLEKDKLLEEMYNGVLIDRNDFFADINFVRKDYVAFEPNQIKLADGTNTTFDGNNPDIRFDGGGLVDFTFEKLPDDYKDFYQIRAYKNIGGERYYFSRLNTHAEKDVFTIETKEGKEIARATLNETENYLINIRVNENYRRKGFGLNLYNFIEYVTGIKLKPSPIKISQQAKALWNKRNPDIRFMAGGETAKQKIVNKTYGWYSSFKDRYYKDLNSAYSDIERVVENNNKQFGSLFGNDNPKDIINLFNFIETQKGVVIKPKLKKIEPKKNIEYNTDIDLVNKQKQIWEYGHGIEIGRYIGNLQYLNTNDERIYGTEKTDEQNILAIINKLKNGDELPPILLDYDYGILDGHHRFEASKRLKIKKLPVIIYEYPDNPDIKFMAGGELTNNDVLKNFVNQVEAYQSNHYGTFNRDNLVESYHKLPDSIKEKIKPISTKNLFRGADGTSYKSAISFTKNQDYAKMFGAYAFPFNIVKENKGLIDTKRLSALLSKMRIANEIGDDEGEVIVIEPIFSKDIIKNIEKFRFDNGGLIAPNGKPSNLTPEQYKLVRTKAFKDWFGDWENDPENASKVVDENGEPLVVYHGTEEKFTIFKDEGVVAKTMGKSVGFYFTPSKWSASRRSIDGDYIEVFLNIKKLFKLKKFSNDEDFIKILGNELKEAIGLPERAETYWYLKNGSGYDGREEYNVGSVVKELSLKKGIEGYYFLEFMSYDEGVVPVYQVFESKNVKLADGTNTTFDGSNPDIRFDGGGSLSNYKDFWNSVIIEDGSKYIGQKFADVFPFIGKRTTPAQFRISIKEYNKLLGRLDNDNYTTKGLKTADLNKLEKTKKYIDKIMYLSRFYLDPSGTIIGFDNTDNKYKDSGVDDVFTINTYSVTSGSDDYSHEEYTGDNYDEALDKYESITSNDFVIPNGIGNHKVLTKWTKKYRFIGELEEGYEISDFTDDLEDEDYWELIGEDYEDIFFESVEAINKVTDDYIYEIQQYINYEYVGDKIGSKYMRIDVYADEEKENYLDHITIRTTDHSQNPANKTGSYNLSFVIADANDTKHRWRSRDEYYFDSSDDLEDIKSEIKTIIEEKIQEVKEDYE